MSVELPSVLMGAGGLLALQGLAGALHVRRHGGEVLEYHDLQSMFVKALSGLVIASVGVLA